MNKRILELAINSATQLHWDFPSDPKEYTFSPSDVEKFAELIVRELVSQLTVEGSDFYHNECNNYGCITVNYFVAGDPHRMRGEEQQSKFWDGVRGTGRYYLNEKFVQHLMKQHFGVEDGNSTDR